MRVARMLSLQNRTPVWVKMPKPWPAFKSSVYAMKRARGRKKVQHVCRTAACLTPNLVEEWQHTSCDVASQACSTQARIERACLYAILNSAGLGACTAVGAWVWWRLVIADRSGILLVCQLSSSFHLVLGHLLMPRKQQCV